MQPDVVTPQVENIVHNPERVEDDRMQSYVKDQLSGISFLNPDTNGQPIPLKERVGEKLYPLYENLVAARVKLLLSENNDNLVHVMQQIEKDEQKAYTAGLSGDLIMETRRRAKSIKEDYRIGEKMKKESSVFWSQTGGQDPQSFLQDGSHRNSLGYTPTSQKVT